MASAECSELEYAVALMLLWLDGNQDFWVAFLRERKSKPMLFKKSGMIGIPCESYDPDRDSNEDDTFRALIKEELGKSHNEIRYIRGEEPINGFPHKVPVYVGVSLLQSREVFYPRDPQEASFYGWLPVPAVSCIHDWTEEARVETKSILREGFRLFEERGHELVGGANA